MMDATAPRRPVRARQSRYRALETLVYPKHEADARRLLAGERFAYEQAKANPGDPVPDWLIDVSPGVLSKGRVEMAGDPPAAGEEV